MCCCTSTAQCSSIVFELGFDGSAQVVACYKPPRRTSTPAAGYLRYFATTATNGRQRGFHATAPDLASHTEQLLHRLIPFPAPTGSAGSLGRASSRYRQREVARTVAKLEKTSIPPQGEINRLRN